MSTHLLSLQSALENLPQTSRLMGLDLGTKSIGIATSDRSRQIATPITTITRTKFTKDATELLAIATKENVGVLVLGLPINMDGTEGPRAQATRAFARNLAKLTPLAIVFWDERLSTAAVERMLIDADASRATRDKVVDKLAAAWILQAALDALRQS
ncbi:MAG TPA: Holliday junction resolvase RuvX [Aestuariivirga sp.]|nr:Holliday junction resolvase RuvX [Hyphomicrobiales bacterium]HRA92912.1 Holliday junction resolvase RuvX [Aestuariivirga sp.]